MNEPFVSKKILLHCCCAPCACSIIDRMLESQISPTVYFYNPNIFPQDEYSRRKEEVMRFSKKRNVAFIDEDGDEKLWGIAIRGLEEESERGKRCDACFQFRLDKTAQYAQKAGYKFFATSLGISRWKDLGQVNAAGKRAELKTKGVMFWDMNWRVRGGQEMMTKLIREENFYRQTYCGCKFSLENSLMR